MELTVRTGPQEYICKEGVIQSLSQKLEKKNIQNIVLVHGQKSWQAARDYLKSIFNDDFQITLVTYKGECTYQEVDRIKSLIKDNNAQAIIAVGGGKLIDTVKYAAANTPGIYSVIIPTLASNCAPWTPISVMYDSNGTFRGFDIHDHQVSLLLIEPNLILTSPIEYFIAGIGDTLAKWYESRKMLSHEKFDNNLFLNLAYYSAKSCQKNIFDHGQDAIIDFRSNKITKSFILIVETIISMGGLVGGFGDRHARTTLAHAVHDALTHYSVTNDFLHGNKVAYGVFVQLAYEDDWAELDKLTAFYDELKLPKSLAELSIVTEKNTIITELTKIISNNHTLKRSGYDINFDKLNIAIRNLEAHFS